MSLRLVSADGNLTFELRPGLSLVLGRVRQMTAIVWTDVAIASLCACVTKTKVIPSCF